VLAVGDRVVIGGLNGAVELNGKVAVVFGIDSEAGRYIVELENGGLQKKVRRENLTPTGTATGVLAARARAAAAAKAFAASSGAAAAAAANFAASSGSSTAFTGEAAQTPVRTRATGTSASSGTPPRVPERSSGQFPQGTRVFIGGLSQAPELNGKPAIVRGFDDSTGRYIVELQDGGMKKSLKPSNLSKFSEASMAARDRKFSALDAELQGQMEDERLTEAPMARLSTMPTVPGLG